MPRTKFEIEILKECQGMEKGHRVRVNSNVANSMIERKLAKFVNKKDAELMNAKYSSIKHHSKEAKKANEKAKPSIEDGPKEEKKEVKKTPKAGNGLKPGKAAKA